MPFNVQNWKTRVDGTFVFNNRYDFTITFPTTSTFPTAFTGLAPPGFTTPLSTILTMLTDRCIATALPGQSIRSSDANRHGLGVHEKMPFGLAYTDLPATFIADNKQDACHTFWKAWLEHTASSQLNNNGRTAGTIEYKDNLTATIQINEYDMDGSKIASVYIFEAYPLAVNDAEISWNDTNKLMMYNVVLTYYNWAFTNLSAGQTSGGNLT